MSTSCSVETYTAKIRKSALNNVVIDLVEVKRANNGRIPRDEYRKAVSSLKKIGVVLLEEALWKRVEREAKKYRKLTGKISAY